MDKNIQTLIERINTSNLSEEDKKNLIKELNKAEPDIPRFTSKLLMILKVSKEILKLFDIDIWDDFNF